MLTFEERKTAHDDVLIRNVRIFDGSKVAQADSVAFRDGLIAEIGIGLRACPGSDEVDAAGSTLLPGLIDAHVHAQRIDNLRQALAFGVTTELDMFCTPAQLVELREAAATRTDVADIRSSGVGVTAPGGHPTQLVQWGVYPPFPTLADPRDAAAFVADRVAEGVDYVKVFIEDGTFWGTTRQTLSPESVRAVISAAHAYGKRSSSTPTAVRAHGSRSTQGLMRSRTIRTTPTSMGSSPNNCKPGDVS